MGVFIATPHTRPLFAGYVDSLFFSKAPKPKTWKPLPNHPIDEARDKLVKNMFDQPVKYDAILFADSDARWDDEAIMRLWERDLPIVCGTMYTRFMPVLPTISQFIRVREEDGHWLYNAAKTCELIHEYIELHKIKKFGRHGGFPEIAVDNAVTFPKMPEDIVEVDGCGMHFTLIRREVFENMEPPYFQLRNKTGAGEDFYFCQKAQAAGYKIYWDRSVHTEHLVNDYQGVGLVEFAVFDHFLPGYENVDWLV